MGFWNREFAPIVLAAIEEGEKAGLSGKELEAFVRSRRPWWANENYPYKAWLREVRFWLKLKSRRHKDAPTPLFDDPDRGSNQ